MHTTITLEANNGAEIPFVVEYLESNDGDEVTGLVYRDVISVFHAGSFIPCTEPAIIADIQEQLNGRFA